MGELGISYSSRDLLLDGVGEDVKFVRQLELYECMEYGEELRNDMI